MNGRRNIFTEETHFPVHEQDVECLGEFTHVQGLHA